MTIPGFFGVGVGDGLGVDDDDGIPASVGGVAAGVVIGWADIVMSPVFMPVMFAAGVGDGVGVAGGLGGLYCSARAGVERPSVGSFASRLSSAESSMFSGSSCCVINASTPIFPMRSTSPGRAPKVSREMTCWTRWL